MRFKFKTDNRTLLMKTRWWWSTRELSSRYTLQRYINSGALDGFSA